MGIFGNSSPFDADVEKATSEKNTSEEWGLIMDICDKVGTSTVNAKDCLRSVVKRLGNPDPHIVVQAITLLDACVNNCGRNFHLEIASRDFETEYRKLLTKAQPVVAQKLKGLLKKWAEGEFKSDPQLNLIPSLVSKLHSEGLDFGDIADMPTRKKESNRAATAKAVSKEEEDLARAIELSLQESKQSSPRNSASAASSGKSLYPSMSSVGAGGAGSTGGAPPSSSAPAPEARKVRALYDFEAAEDNELTFLAGEIIHVIDGSDPNWWKGYNQRGEGLFPANFVTSDLTEPQTPKAAESKKNVQFSDAVHVKNIEEDNQADEETIVEIDEQKIDRLLSLLHEANPEDGSYDTQEMLQLESEVYRMGPLIDNALEQTDRRHAQLSQLSSDLVDSLNMYHSLMRSPHQPQHQHQPGVMMKNQFPTSQPTQHFPGPGQPMYNGTPSFSSLPPAYFQHGLHSTPGVAVPPVAVSGAPSSHQMSSMGLPPHLMMSSQPPSSMPPLNQQYPQHPSYGPSGAFPIHHPGPAPPPAPPAAAQPGATQSYVM